jgi:solute carrier family 45 protein 1/2/4
MACFTAANAWQGRVSAVGNVLGFGLGFTDLGHSRALAWLPGGQTAHLFVVSITLCVFFTFITCFFIEEEDHPEDDSEDQGKKNNLLNLLKNIRTNFVRLPYPVRRVW